MSRRLAYPLIAIVAAVPRLVVLLHERDAIVHGVEKSFIFAQVFVQDGTYGFIPGQPSAYTQPLYGWFLVPIWWLFDGNWLAVGLAQIAVAVVVAWLVYEIARRLVPRRWAIVAAVLATLHPYLVWHDVHVNREIIDQLCAAALVLLTLQVAERPRRGLEATAAEPPSPGRKTGSPLATLGLAALLGVVAGLSMLGNTRLVFIPIVCVAYLAFRHVPALPLALVLAGAAVAVTPWLVRNEVNVGCLALTTDGRALWKANNPQTYGLLSSGKWIDDVRPDSPRPPEPGHLTPEEARGRYDATNHRVVLHPDECLEMSFYEHLAFRWAEHHPGAKLKLAALSEQLFWQPDVIETGGSSGGFGRQVAEPAYMSALYLLAAIGLFVASRAFVALALVLFAYQSFWAAAFVGATRYRVAFDFLLVLLATAALSRARRT